MRSPMPWVACSAHLVDAKGLPVYWYLLPLGILAAANLIIVRLLATRDLGLE